MSTLLDGIRVLDFGRYVAAPFCGQILADLGAEVIRVERPGGEADRTRPPLTDDGGSLYFTCLNRNKKAIVLDLRQPEGQAVLGELVEKADVLVHNLPMDRAERLGLGYGALAATNPRLIYLGISGFGTAGPRARDVAFDGIVQAMSGAMSMTGPPGPGPVLSHIPYVDFATGIYGASSIQAALFDRERTGRGHRIDVSLYGAVVSFVTAYAVVAEYALNGLVRGQIGNDFLYGTGGSFPTKDGQLVVNVFSNAMWAQLCEVIGRPELLEDPGLADDLLRYERRADVNAAIAPWISERTTQEAVQVLAEAGVAVGPVQTVDQLLTDPQVGALDAFAWVDQPGIGRVPVATPPIKVDGATAAIGRPAPAVGEHNDDVYGGLLGYDADRIAELASSGII